MKLTFLFVVLMVLYDVTTAQDDVRDVINDEDIDRAIEVLSRLQEEETNPDLTDGDQKMEDTREKYDMEGEADGNDNKEERDPLTNIMKRFYIKVVRQYCPPGQQCLGFRGRHRWQRCTCPGRTRCQKSPGYGYECL
uniref:Uncharacterized LOC100180122 n=1 Tax=Ciona intestinalis TaxID=7719 RepID=H2XRA4_CIOIN|nr:uncharacterized protein LOC100180122 [Ciona intestinalis]|eukprot:XP_002129860.1 uncharacterized protein LOC100180122 [Ciona intestinalis]